MCRKVGGSKPSEFCFRRRAFQQDTLPFYCSLSGWTEVQRTVRSVVQAL